MIDEWFELYYNEINDEWLKEEEEDEEEDDECDSSTRKTKT